MAETLTKIKTASQQTWQSESSSHSSTSSASRYNLDDEDGKSILVYRRSGDVCTSSQKDLCWQLDHGACPNTAPTSNSELTLVDMQFTKLRVTKKTIPRFAATVEVKQHDLYMPDEQEQFRAYPTYDSSLAEIILPSKVYWSRMLLGSYDQLYILSEERNPAYSSEGSLESRKISPSSTFSHDAGTGAERD